MADFDELGLQQTQQPASIPGASEASEASDTPRGRDPILTRREVAKIAVTGLSALAVGAVLPKQWLEPIVQVAFLPAHAVGTVVATPTRRMDGTRIKYRMLQPAQEQVPTSVDPRPTEQPKPPDNEVKPPPEPKPNPEPSGGGESGSDTQPKTDTAPGTGGRACPPTGPAVSTPTGVAVACTSTTATVTWAANGERSFHVDIIESSSGAIVASADTLGPIRTFTGLKSCAGYRAVVTARRCDATSGPSSPAFFQTLMDPNSKPVVSIPDADIYCDGFYAEWQPIPCATAYEVQISEDGVTWKSTTISSSSGKVVASILDLCPDKDYYIRVQGIGSGNVRSQFSERRQVRTKKMSGSYPCKCEEHTSSPSPG